MNPYWSGDGIELWHGRCEDVLPTIEPGSVDALLTDPPYFQVKDEDWDNQWDKAAEFLEWLGTVTDQVKPVLRPHASVWMFASPQLTSSVERLVAERFRVLNTVRWVKEAGWHQKASPESLRRFLTPWEGIIFGEQFDDAYGDMALALHKQVFAPLGRYIQQERERAGLTRSELEVQLGYVSTSDPTRGTALAYRWEEGSSLPTADTYERMRLILGAGFLRREYEDLRREYEDLRRPFTLPTRGPKSDVWNFNPATPYPGKHPCEKPQAMLRHMIQTSTRLGATILDCFAGSGSTLLAARDTGRKAIGIEMDERWCEHAARKLDQGVLDFGDPA